MGLSATVKQPTCDTREARSVLVQLEVKRDGHAASLSGRQIKLVRGNEAGLPQHFAGPTVNRSYLGRSL